MSEINTSKPDIRRRKNISLLSFTLFKINNHSFTSTDHVLCRYNKKSKNIRIISFFTYKQHRIYLNKNSNIERSRIIKKVNVKKDIMSNEYKENIIRTEINKNYNITPKEISKLTGLSLYIVNRFYMKIRRENSRGYNEIKN